MTAASDVPEAVRPWLDALRAVWPEMGAVYSEVHWLFSLVPAPTSDSAAAMLSINPHAGALVGGDYEKAIRYYPDPASLVARLRELLPVPAKPEPECIPCDAGDRHRVPTLTATYTCERCAISWVTADGARCPGCERAERRARKTPDDAVTAMGRLLDPVPAPQANPLRDASRRLVDEHARYQRAGRGTSLPSEMLAAVEDVRAALEVGGG